MDKDIIEFQQLMITVIDHAQTRPHITFQFLTNWSNYKYQRERRKYIKLLLKILDRMVARLFKRYCASITAGDSKITTLLAFKQLQQVRKYYEVELQVITEMIREYEAYLLEGNYLWAFLGKLRSEADMRDFRE